MNNLVSIILVYLALSRKEMKENVTETNKRLIKSDRLDRK